MPVRVAGVDVAVVPHGCGGVRRGGGIFKPGEGGGVGELQMRFGGRGVFLFGEFGSWGAISFSADQECVPGAFLCPQASGPIPRFEGAVIGLMAFGNS